MADNESDYKSWKCREGNYVRERRKGRKVACDRKAERKKKKIGGRKSGAASVERTHRREEEERKWRVGSSRTSCHE